MPAYSLPVFAGAGLHIIVTNKQIIVITGAGKDVPLSFHLTTQELAGGLHCTSLHFNALHYTVLKYERKFGQQTAQSFLVGGFSRVTLVTLQPPLYPAPQRANSASGGETWSLIVGELAAF